MQLRLVENVRAGVGKAAGTVATVAGVYGDFTGDRRADALYHAANGVKSACDGNIPNVVTSAAKAYRFASTANTLVPADPSQPTDNYYDTGQKLSMVA